MLDLSTEVPLSSDLASPEPEPLAALDPTSPAYMCHDTMKGCR